jgi:hypothetical protein
MMKTLGIRITVCTALLAANVVFAQDHAGAPPAGEDPMASCPMHAQHMAATGKDHAAPDGSAEHGREVDSRHDSFGMPHEGSTHSFRLFPDGGAIELRATGADDEKTVAMIRAHLQHVAEEFRGADFSTPAFVHGGRPDGVAEMARLRSEISYRYESLPAGGRIRITAKGAAALAAIHAFLRFQVTEHRTADSGKVEEDK